MTAKQCTFEILDEMSPGKRFTSIALMLMVKEKTGEIHLPDTCMRYAREYRRSSGRGIVNVDKRRSIYEVY